MITVYHLSDERFRQRVLYTGLNVDQQDYFEVATVETDYVGEAYYFTQHFHQRWTRYQAVKPSPNAPYHRSSMIGDIMHRHHNDTLYLVMGTGYKVVQWGNHGILPYDEPGDDIDEAILYAPDTQES